MEHGAPVFRAPGWVGQRSVERARLRVGMMPVTPPVTAAGGQVASRRPECLPKR
jgi:hypothetical protein